MSITKPASSAAFKSVFDGIPKAPRKKSTTRLTKREIASRIRVTGVFGNYVLHTGGFGGMPSRVDLTNIQVAFVFQRTLRALADAKPDLFGSV
jgi:hypothetical protein